MKVPLFRLLVVVGGIMIVGISTAQNLDRRYHYARSYEESGDWKRAAAIYEELYRESPRLEYFEGLVRTYRQLHRYAELAEIVERRLQQQPTVELWALFGDLQWKLGKVQQAQQAWKQALDLKPHDPQTYETVAQVQIQNRLYEQAVVTLLEGREQLADPFAFIEELIQLYGATGEYRKGVREALRWLKVKQNVSVIQGHIAAFLISQKGIQETAAILDSVAQIEESPTFLILYEWFLRETRQYEKALTVVEKLDRYRQPRGRALYEFGDLCLREGRYDVAVRAYQKVLALGKRTSYYRSAMYGAVDALENLVRSADTLDWEQLEYVEQQYRKIIELFPETSFAAKAQYRLGVLALELRKDWEKAAEELRKALRYRRFDQIVSMTLLKLAELALRQDQLDSAQWYYQQVYQQTSKRLQDLKVQAQYGLAELQYFAGNLDSAKTLFAAVAAQLQADAANDALEKIILLESYQSEPEREAIRLLAKGMLRQRQQRFAEAQQWYKKALQRAGTSELAAFIQLQMARLFFQQGQWQQTVAMVESLLTQYPNSIFGDRALWLQGQAYEAQKQLVKAVESYSRLLLQYTRSPFVPFARERIKSLGGDV